MVRVSATAFLFQTLVVRGKVEWFTGIAIGVVGVICTFVLVSSPHSTDSFRPCLVGARNKEWSAIVLVV